MTQKQQSIIDALSSLKKDDIKVIGLAQMPGGKELVIEKTLQVFVTVGLGNSNVKTTTYPLEKYKHCITMFDTEYSLNILKQDQVKLQDLSEKI